MDHWWVILFLPILLALCRVVRVTTAVVLAAVLGLASFMVGWLPTLAVSVPMVAAMWTRMRRRMTW